MAKITVKEVRERIKGHALFSFSAGYRLSGRSVEVKNIKILKDTVIADVILHDDEEDIHERLNKCEYPIKYL